MTVAHEGIRGFRWGLVLGLSATQLISWGSLYYSFAVLVGPMEAELGWSKTHTNGALSLGLGVTGLVALNIGRWIDRHGGRLLMTAGSVAAMILLLLWSQATQLWHLYAVWAGMGLVFGCVLYEAAFATVTRALGPEYRRGIITITLAGALASTVFLPLTQSLVEFVGWRGALVALALVQVPCCAAVHWLILTERTSDNHAAANPASHARDGSLGRAMRHPVFWWLAASYVAYAFMFTALVFHIIPMLAERGIAPRDTIAAYALVGPAQLLGRVVMWSLDRWIGVRVAGVVATVLPVIAILILMSPQLSPGLLATFALLFGIGMGIKTIVQATAAPELLGREGYGALQGALSIPFYVAQAVTPFLAALLWSLTGGYNAVLWAVFCGAVIAAFAFVCASLPRTKDAMSAQGPRNEPARAGGQCGQGCARGERLNHLP